MMKRMMLGVSAFGALMLAMSAQAAPVVLNTGTVSMGVNDYGGLGGSGVGFVGPTGDAIMPGCLCEGWGAAANGSSGYTYGGSATAFASSNTTGSGATGSTISVLNNGLQVSQAYSSAAGGQLFKVAVTMTNTTGATLSNVRYARTLDWDVSPGYFNGNYTTVYGGTPTGPGGKVLSTSTNPFAAPDPMALRTQDQDTNVVDQPGDLGSYFVFAFGDLAAGASVTFDTYIGAGRTVRELLAALGAVEVEAYSYTTGNSTGADGRPAPAYGYGFVGLGLPPSLPGDVPEPATLALMGLAMGAMAWNRRRRH